MFNQEKILILILKKKSLETGKKLIYQKFQLLLVNKIKKHLLNSDLKSTDGEVNGNKGIYFLIFRGVGQLKFLQNKQNQLIRCLVRAEKTHKVVVNHLLQAKDIFCKLEPLKTSNNAWTWAAYDVSDEKPET